GIRDGHVTGVQTCALPILSDRRFICQPLDLIALERDQIEGLTDEATIGQLAGILYQFDSQGRIKIESKEKARARGVSSPDRAERSEERRVGKVWRPRVASG